MKNKNIKPVNNFAPLGLEKLARKKAAKDKEKFVTTLYLNKSSIYILEVNNLNRSLVVDQLLKEFILKNKLSLKAG